MIWNEFTESITTIALAIVGVAFLAVLVSKNAQTPAVIQASASGFGNALDTAISPVTGQAVAPNLQYPGNSNGFTGNIPGLS
jgi:PRD1 phage membrane DNA delivery